MTLRPANHRTGMSLLETLVAIAVFGTLIGLLLVAIHRVREQAARTSCQAHLKSLILAVHAHHSAKGTMPPYASGRPGEMYGGWYMHLLPYVGRGELHELIRASSVTQRGGLTIMTTGQSLPAVRDAAFSELVCAADPTRQSPNNTTNYLANWYALSDGVRGTYRRAQRFDSLSNGLSNVVVFAEAYSECAGLTRLALYSAHYHNFGITQEGMPSDDPWYAPKDYLMFQARPDKCDSWRTQTGHDVMHVATADGSVRAVATTISPETWKSVMKARDGSTPGEDW